MVFASVAKVEILHCEACVFEAFGAIGERCCYFFHDLISSARFAVWGGGVEVVTGEGEDALVMEQGG